MKSVCTRAKLTVCTLLILTATAAPMKAAYDLANGNAPFEVVIQTVAPIIFADVSPSGGDASLVLRVTTLVTNSWFDASAPYHATALGVYSRLGRQPVPERTTRNINIACLYASYHVLNSLLPKRNAEWRAMMQFAGLDPNDNSMDTTTPEGIGNAAGKAVVAARENDGMNQLGNVGGVDFNRLPYSDYTGYEPVNTAYDLRDPSRWQPRIVPGVGGVFRVQQFVTPQYRNVRPYSYNTPNEFHVPRPDASTQNGPRGRQAYQAQADEVLAASANLDDHKKMVAELFDNKIYSLGFSVVGVARARQLSLMDFIHLDFVTNVAAFDTGIVIWKEKNRWDAVRPFSAIRYLYRNQPVNAWGGPGNGTVSLPADQWKEYLNVADHPEYPSASSAFCAAHAESAKRFLGTDSLADYAVPAPQGSSRVEPGITPASDMMLTWPTWTEFARECAESRVWAGVHFRAAIKEGPPIGRQIGGLAYDFVMRHIQGNVPPLN